MKKIFFAICLISILSVITTPVFAGIVCETLPDGSQGNCYHIPGDSSDPIGSGESGDNSGGQEQDKNAGGILNNIIGQGNNFTGTDSGIGKKLSDFITGEVLEVVVVIGNLIFAAVTVILGAKYIWSSAEGKAGVMESLPTFVAAVVFFYLGENLVNWLTGAGNAIAGANSWDVLSNNLIWIVNTIVHYAAFGGILFLGLRYMFASAEGKSQIKANMGGMVIGIVFVFAASSVVDFIIKVANEVI